MNRYVISLETFSGIKKSFDKLNNGLPVGTNPVLLMKKRSALVQ